MGQVVNPSGTSEFMLRIMAWLCTVSETQVARNCQMCIVTGPNIDIAINLITPLKNIFERKLGLTFTDKETVLLLNGCRIEAFPYRLKNKRMEKNLT